jgi:MOSC domain-containing protein YiiM
VLGVEIRHLFISPGHNFFGHHGRAPDEYPIIEVPEIECVAGHGVKGDRYFDYREDYKGQITFFSLEIFDAVRVALNVANCPPSASRRNVITAGVDLMTLVGEDFEIQGVRFHGTEHCRPCYWMNRAIAPGAEDFLNGLTGGGLRARILSDGIIRAKRNLLGRVQ